LTNRSLPLSLISGTSVRKALQLSRQAFVDFALLLGTDFTTRVRKLGPHTAIKLIRAHGSIERVLAEQSRFVVAPEEVGQYLEQVETARLVFETLPPVPGPEILRPSESVEDVQAILREYKIGSAELADEGWENGGRPMAGGSGGGLGLGANYFGDDPMDPAGAERGWQSASL
jgi:flap endonuclease-1